MTLGQVQSECQSVSELDLSEWRARIEGGGGQEVQEVQEVRLARYLETTGTCPGRGGRQVPDGGHPGAP